MAGRVVVEQRDIRPDGAATGIGRMTCRRISPRHNLMFSWPNLIGVALFVSVACAFYISPVNYLSDSGFSLLMDEALIHKWTPDMIEFQVPRGHGGVFINEGYPWNVKIIKGRLLYVYPWGSSLLSLPAVALFNAVGFKIAPHRTGYQYNWYNELRMQVLIATGVCALTIWVVYLAAIRYLPLGWSLAIALGTAFGTPIWSSASRSLWPQTWAVLLMMVGMWILLRGSDLPFVLGSVLAWSCLVRPTMIPQVAAATVYILFSYDHRFVLRYIGGTLCSLTPICTMMLFFTGGLFSVAYPGVLFDFPRQFGLRLYGVLFSPSRGLLIFSPFISVALYLVIRYWRVLPERRLATLGLVNIGMYIIVLSSYLAWWGGNSYGPRLMLEVVPWFVLLAILGVMSFVKDPHLSVRWRLTTTSIAGLTLALSIVANAPGALFQNSINWKPYDEDHLDVLWDWHDPQFLCWIQGLQN